MTPFNPEDVQQINVYEKVQEDIMEVSAAREVRMKQGVAKKKI